MELATLEALKAHRRGAECCHLLLRLSQGWQLPEAPSNRTGVRCPDLAGRTPTILSSNMGRTPGGPYPIWLYRLQTATTGLPTGSNRLYVLCTVITIVVDLIGNSMVILAVSKNKKLRNSGKTPTHGAATSNP